MCRFASDEEVARITGLAVKTPSLFNATQGDPDRGVCTYPAITDFGLAAVEIASSQIDVALASDPLCTPFDAGIGSSTYLCGDYKVLIERSDGYTLVVHETGTRISDVLPADGNLDRLLDLAELVLAQM